MIRQLLSASVLLMGCSPALFVPGNLDFPDPVVLKEMMVARTIYVAKCGSCHTLHLPEDYTEEKWEAELEVMQKRARISDSDRTAILNFILNAKKAMKR